MAAPTSPAGQQAGTEGVPLTAEELEAVAPYPSLQALTSTLGLAPAEMKRLKGLLLRKQKLSAPAEGCQAASAPSRPVNPIWADYKSDLSLTPDEEERVVDPRFQQDHLWNW